MTDTMTPDVPQHPRPAYEFHDRLVAAGFKHHPLLYYDTYVKYYCNSKDERNCRSYYRIYVSECDKFYDMAISCAPAAYAGDPNVWHGLNLGRMESFEIVQGFVELFDRKFNVVKNEDMGD
jgi:hypothetical protein